MFRFYTTHTDHLQQAANQTIGLSDKINLQTCNKPCKKKNASTHKFNFAADLHIGVEQSQQVRNVGKRQHQQSFFQFTTHNDIKKTESNCVLYYYRISNNTDEQFLNQPECVKIAYVKNQTAEKRSEFAKMRLLKNSFLR